MAIETGLLSQAIQNIRTMSQQLASVAGLPPDAQGIESSVVGLLQQELAKVAAMQTTATQFVTASLPGLQQAKLDLDNGTNQDQIATIITQTQASATGIKQNVDALCADIAGTKDKIADLLTNRLAPIKTRLEADRITINTQLQSAQQEAEAIRSKEKYFAFLLIFGLIGLAATGIALAVQEGKVNNLLAQASNQRAQVTHLDMMIQSVNLLVTDLGDILNRISNVANAVGFIASDNSQVLADLKNVQGEQLHAKLYLITTIGQLQTLGNDAA